MIPAPAEPLPELPHAPTHAPQMTRITRPTSLATMGSTLPRHPDARRDPAPAIRPRFFCSCTTKERPRSSDTIRRMKSAPTPKESYAVIGVGLACLGAGTLPIVTYRYVLLTPTFAFVGLMI